MLIQVKRPEEMSQHVWEGKWNEIKIRVHMIAGDITAVMGLRDYPRNWGEILTCMNTLMILEKIVRRSDAKRGWCGNPMETIERLIKSIVTIDEPELSNRLAELEVLSHEVEDLMTVS
jgi:hypothetical protein